MYFLFFNDEKLKLLFVELVTLLCANRFRLSTTAAFIMSYYFPGWKVFSETITLELRLPNQLSNQRKCNFILLLIYEKYPDLNELNEYLITVVVAVNSNNILNNI